MITPNMHMHCHMRDILLDYGPVYSFWCFLYEHYNGILGKQPNNNKEIEPQLMQRFLADNFVFSLESPTSFQQDFDTVCLPSPRLSGSLLQIVTPMNITATKFEPPKRYTRIALDANAIDSIADIPN